MSEKFDLKALAEPIMVHGDIDEMRDMLEEAVGWSYIETDRANEAEHERDELMQNTVDFLIDLDGYLKLTTNELSSRIENYKDELQANIQFAIDMENAI